MKNAKNPATKADLNRLDLKIDRLEVRLTEKIDAARSESKNDFEKLAVRIVDTNARLDAVADTLRSEMRAGFRKMDDRMDFVAGMLQDFRRETAIFPRLLDGHGKRIRALESRRPR